MKTFLIAAIIATLIASVCVAAQEMANAANSELLLKLMAFVSLIIFDIYAVVAILRNKDK